MRRSIAMTVAMFFLCTSASAQELPGIDRPPNEVAAKLSEIFQCRMSSGGDALGCRSNPGEASVELALNSRGDEIDKAEVDLLIATRRGRPTAEELTATDATIEAMMYLAPSWQKSLEWLTSAIAAADQQKACSYIKLNGVVLVVLPHRAVDTPGSFATIYVTRHFDLYSLCDY